MTRRITHSLDTRHGIQIEVWLPGASLYSHPHAGSASSRLMKAWGTQALVGLVSKPMTTLLTFTVKSNPRSSHRSDDLTTTHQRLSNEQCQVFWEWHPHECVHFGVDVGILLIKQASYSAFIALAALHISLSLAQSPTHVPFLTHTPASCRWSAVLVHPTHPRERRARVATQKPCSNAQTLTELSWGTAAGPPSPAASAGWAPSR